MSEQQVGALLPCPFCGEEPQTREQMIKGGKAWATCEKCLPKHWFDLEKWNTRPTTIPVGELEKVLSMFADGLHSNVIVRRIKTLIQKAKGTV